MIYLLLPLFAIIAGFAIGVRKITQVSRGTEIGKRSNQALLLIDLQTVFWDGGFYSDESKVEARDIILAEIQAAREIGAPIIAVRQEWSIPSTKFVALLTMKGAAIAGTAGTELAAPFADVADHVIVKRVQDAFETGALDTLLETLNVGRLTLMGLDTNHCVAKTACAAIIRGYQVDILTKATLAAQHSRAKRTLATLSAKGVVLRSG